MTNTAKELAPVAAAKKARRRKEATALAPENLRAQGLRTRNAIVRAARKLLLEGGGLDFSLRAVAVKAGISISNVQYYFPSRVSVLRAVMEPVVLGYMKDLDDALESAVSPMTVIKGLLSRVLRDAKDAKMNALWWHFASLAAVDDECSRLQAEWFNKIADGLGHSIRAAVPGSSVADSTHLAQVLIAIGDGLALQYGGGRYARMNLDALESRVFSTVDVLLRDLAAATAKR